MADYELVEHPEALVVRLCGSLDAYLRDFTPRIERRLREGPRHLVVDLSGVDYVGSRGMGLLFGLQKMLKDLGKRLLIAAPSAPVKDALGVGGLDLLLEMHDTEQAALEACGAS